MKSSYVLASAFAVSCAISAFADDVATDYRSWIQDKGGTPVIAGGTSGKAYHKDYPPAKAFDGDVSTASANRYLGSLSNGAHLVYGADIAGETFTMTHYRICQPRANDYGNARAPTAWTLYGSDSSAGPWTVIESQSGVVWASTSTAKSSDIPGLDDCWRTFALATPQTYKFYKIAFSASRAASTSWNVGVTEVEFISAPSSTVTIVPPHAESLVLSNDVAFAEKVFDESAYPADEQHALSYKGFDAVADSMTTFIGGWWNFGAGAFLPTDASRRLVTLDGGAVVTNVGDVTLAGSTGLFNKLRIKGASTMSAANVTFGAKNDTQGNECEVTGGSSLTVGGNLKMSAFTGRASATARTKNVMTVAGEGTSLTVGGSTLLSWNSSDYNGSTGGNTLYVTNGATASLGNLRLVQALYFGGDDAAYFGDRARVTTKSIAMANTWSSPTERKGVARLVVADGACVTNTGTLVLGNTGSNNRSGTDTIELVVSNGTFYTESWSGTGKISELLSGPRATIRLTGKDAKATFHCSTSSSVLFSRANNQFIVENGANFHWPWGSFSYTAQTWNESLIVRGEGTRLTFGALNNTAGGESYRVYCYTNRFVFADGAVAEGSAGSTLRVGGDGGELDVSNATVSVTYSKYSRVPAEPVGSGGNMPALCVGVHFQYGGYGTNCIVRISGTKPQILCTNGASADFRRTTKLVYNLPAEGYDAGIVPIDVGNVMAIDATCTIALNGVAEMGDALAAKPGRKQTLIRAKTLDIPASVLDATRATLPQGYRLLLVGNAGVEQRLVLHRPAGLTIIIR